MRSSTRSPLAPLQKWSVLSTFSLTNSCDRVIATFPVSVSDKLILAHGVCPVYSFISQTYRERQLTYRLNDRYISLSLRNHPPRQRRRSYRCIFLWVHVTPRLQAAALLSPPIRRRWPLRGSFVDITCGFALTSLCSKGAWSAIEVSSDATYGRFAVLGCYAGKTEMKCGCGWRLLLAARWSVWLGCKLR